MGEVLIQCQDVWKYYGRKEALRGLDFQLSGGRIVGLLGPNGSGKTTLMKVLNGLLRPEKGVVLIDGEEPGIYTKSVVSYLPDKTYFADWMKVSDLFDLFQDFYEDFDREKAEQMCETLQIQTNQKMILIAKHRQKPQVQEVIINSPINANITIFKITDNLKN